MSVRDQATPKIVAHAMSGSKWHINYLFNSFIYDSASWYKIQKMNAQDHLATLTKVQSNSVIHYVLSYNSKIVYAIAFLNVFL